MDFQIFNGDALEVLRTLKDNSVDSIVTDPPYGISFMGKKWDYEVPSVEVFKECLRVLKPGGHALIACGTRTQHRMAVNIEDAGFEIRDVITWLYGSGFPKSLDISKAIDKAAGAERERYNRPAFGGTFSDDKGTTYGTALVNRPATPLAKQWQGWGTALKPACEFWTLARKPLAEKTVAKNVEKYGTGGINVDGCRVGSDLRKNTPAKGFGLMDTGTSFCNTKQAQSTFSCGRFPANLILDEEAGAMLDEQSGILKTNAGTYREDKIKAGKIILEKENKAGYITSKGDSGGASRFFYCAKASKSERGADNNHPTVKPVNLMRYLCRLITPPKGIVLDPFMGSGSTGVAALSENFQFKGIELDKNYAEIAQKRISYTERGRMENLAKRLYRVPFVCSKPYGMLQLAQEENGD